MKKADLSFPELSLIAGTRIALGGGIALLFADRMTEKERRMAGWSLFLIGAASTIPLMKMVLDKRR
ncbi:hypothetical protein LPW11_01735 [Geomonas sp. RF6]|uniref:hypothetical protein n=1 Tax=Geomonas sp. RF6 TaxID=2897342 RepID=UPI001E2CB38D|nr:hypothetical protein [Geomonas sp. RF6]UFS70917.1 hypothetical protein LPW11_01735 [Geomonas sp. RF6]